ncbi:protein kinase family protein [Litoribacter populi]|uniref:hypothetical protein n=1 Tax=Litoribacter populi TaxID=2598460 RepID=UPI00117E6C84|nr:hypothetical protein [Litoribacter populi]
MADNLEDNEREKSRYEFHLKVREYAGREYDRLIVILSGGALTLSIGFLEHFKDGINTCTKWLIIGSWSSLFLSLISILISQLTSLKSIDAELEEKEMLSNIYNNFTTKLNVISLFFLILGVMLFIVFISWNL